MWFVFLEFVVNDIGILTLHLKVSCKQDIITVNRQLKGLHDKRKPYPNISILVMFSKVQHVVEGQHSRRGLCEIHRWVYMILQKESKTTQ